MVARAHVNELRWDVGRVLAVGVACAAACRFAPHTAPSDGAGTDAIIAPGDAPADSSHDATVLVGSACGGKLWHADFSVDPTTIDLNGDGIPDFGTRDGSPLAGVLGSGVWTVPANSAALDTHPAQPFTTRVVMDVVMRDLTRGSGDHSTVVWIDTSYTATSFAVLFLDLRRDSDTLDSQTWTTYGKIDDDETLIDYDYLEDDDVHHFHFDIDPTALTYDLSVDGYDEGTYNYYSMDRGSNNDEWATVDALGGDSEFDDFQVEVCP
jgi:hypothetical protein